MAGNTARCGRSSRAARYSASSTSISLYLKRAPLMGMPACEAGIPSKVKPMGSQPIQVMIVDDHTMVREGLKVLLNEFEDIRVVGDAANGLKAIELVEQLDPD